MNRSEVFFTSRVGNPDKEINRKAIHLMDPSFAFGAGLKDTKIRDSDGNLHDVYGVTTAEGSTTREETEVRGDDQILGTFGSSLREELTIEANAVSFDVLQAITGNQLTETASSNRILLGTTKELNPTFVEVQAFTNAKFKNGDVAEIRKTWFKVQINTVSFSQAGEQEFNATLEGVALQTDLDITGAAIDGLPVGELTVAALEVYDPTAGASGASGASGATGP